MRSPEYFSRVVTVLSIGYFLIFAAFNIAQNLSGSVPGPEHLGQFKFAALYLCFTLVCIPAPKIVSYLGPRRSMVFGATPYAGVLLSHLAPPLCIDGQKTSNCWQAMPIWILNLFVGAACGMGAALLWTGQGVYLSRAVVHAAAASSMPEKYGNSTVQERTSTHETSQCDRDEEENIITYGTSDREVPTLVDESSTTLLGTNSVSIVQQKNLLTSILGKRYNGKFWSIMQFSGMTGSAAAFLITTFVPGINYALFWLFLGAGTVCIAGICVLGICLPKLDPQHREEQLDAEGNTQDGREETHTIPDLLDTLRLCREPSMHCFIPLIFYNGASLGFLWNSFNTLGWSNAAGLSFVGLGATFWYLVNTCFTPILVKLAEARGYISSLAVATVAQGLFYVVFIIFQVAPLTCDPSGCKSGTSGPCWHVSENNNTVKASTFPFDCEKSGNSSAQAECAICAPYDASNGQQCSQVWTQCSLLNYPKADGILDSTNGHFGWLTMALLFFGSFLFAIGDAVFETQIPGILQTVFQDSDSNKAAAMANLKLWQSLGVTFAFALSYTEAMGIMCSVFLSLLAIGSSIVYYAHYRVVNMDTGEKRHT